jgi:5-(carboxyamino)imidazole ribonucleotide mutase
VQMPAGVPVATFAIGEAGAGNAALFAVAMLARTDPALARKLDEFRTAQTDRVLGLTLPDPA